MARKVTLSGAFEPYASGLRSPAGIGFNPDGRLWYAENQGDYDRRVLHVALAGFGKEGPWTDRIYHIVMNDASSVFKAGSPWSKLESYYPLRPAAAPSHRPCTVLTLRPEPHPRIRECLVHKLLAADPPPAICSDKSPLVIACRFAYPSSRMWENESGYLDLELERCGVGEFDLTGGLFAGQTDADGLIRGGNEDGGAEFSVAPDDVDDHAAAGA